MKRSFFFLSFFAALLGAQEAYYYSKGKKVLLMPLEHNQTLKRSAEQKILHYYKNQDGLTLGISDEILIQTDAIEQIVRKYDFKAVEKITRNIYLIHVGDPLKTLDFANKLYEEEDVVFSHPNFYKRVEKR